MKCAQARRLGAMAGLGELNEREREALQRHLASCAACQEAVDDQGWVDLALRSTLAERPPGIDLRPAVMRRIAAAPARGPWLPDWSAARRWAWAPAGLVAAGLLAGLLFWRAQPPHQRAGQHMVGVIAGVPLRPSLGQADSASHVQVTRGGAPAADGEVREGDLLHANGRHDARLRLSDGTLVTLSRGSAARVLASGFQLEEGRLMAAVEPQRQEFIIKTQQAEASVLGTEFAVEITELGSTVVTVARGLVRVRNGHGEELVPAGSFTVARASIPPLEAEAVDTDALLRPAVQTPEEAPMEMVDLAAEIRAAQREVAEKRAQVTALRRGLERLRRQRGGQ